MRVDVNVHVGLFSASQKSALRRWLSRFSSPVLTDAASSWAVTDVDSRSSPTVIVPSVIARVPRTFEIPAWRTVNDACECDASRA
ncbi:Uncharacterised protein [Mycobacteroides abscessus]|nr:Uncharacterised protein [Mycobacteroides abscessus]